jgi:hypothetical protein
LWVACVDAVADDAGVEEIFEFGDDDEMLLEVSSKNDWI